MNVYVRELVGALAQAGVSCTVYVRRWHPDLPDEVEVEPGFTVVHVPAGECDMAKEDLPGIVDEFAEWTLAHIRENPVDVIHANYWLSGVAGHMIKHPLDIPLAVTFHTLARVKAETGDAEPEARIKAESKVIRCSDAILANSTEELAELQRLYDAPGDRIEIVPPGVDHAFFSPGNRAGARKALGLGDEPIMLFVGRIQPLKRLDIAVRALAQLERTDTKLLVVGGPSGAGGQVELDRVTAIADELGVTDRIVHVAPQPHHLLSTYYRAADVGVVPSRSESFGLVALEAAACGIPVVASDVGGLRTLVDHGTTGYLVEGADPADYAARLNHLLGDPEVAKAFGEAGATRAREYTWSTTAGRLRRLYNDLSTRVLVTCE